MFKYARSLFFIFATSIPFFCFCNTSTPSKEQTAPPPIEEQVSTQHEITLAGESIHYTATAGNFLLKDDNGNAKGSVFYISYLKDDTTDKTLRPITFCFNGGPGSSSVWLHMGAFGPRRVQFSDSGVAIPPYSTITNDYSILDLTDLVFIDPISTGYSRPVPGEDAKQFYGVEEDVKWMAEFIRLFVTRLGRWDSPKFVAGESYGGTRAAVLANYLQESINMDLNGAILISPVLDFNTLQSCTNPTDISYALYLPSFTAAAHYHKKIEANVSLPDLLKESEKYALGNYSLALLQGSEITPEHSHEVAESLHKFIGLPTDFIERSNLRVHYFRFIKELLKPSPKMIGRFDARFIGIDSDACGCYPNYDPSLSHVIGAFSATFNQYVKESLHWNKDDQYKILIDVSPWNWGKSSHQSLNVSSDLKEAMTKNPHLQVFVASGLYDLATPYFATHYSFTHLGIDPSLQPHITEKTYEAGHMMYIHEPSLIKFKQDLKAFYSQSLPKGSTP